MDKIRIYLVDDSIIISAMMEMLVARQPQFELCGVAHDAEQALAEIDRCLPDVILLDLGLPGIGGLDVLDAIQAHWHKMSTIVVSGSTTFRADICQIAFEHGAVACFDKTRLVTQADELIDLIREVTAHKIQRSHHKSGTVTLPDPHTQHPKAA